jgi:hypothetical protein
MWEHCIHLLLSFYGATTPTTISSPISKSNLSQSSHLPHQDQRNRADQRKSKALRCCKAVSRKDLQVLPSPLLCPLLTPKLRFSDSKMEQAKKITKKRAEMKRQRELVPWELLQSVLQGKCRNTLLSSRLQLAGVRVTFLPETQPLLVVTAGLQASPTRFPSSQQSHFASVLSRLWKSSLEA